MMLKMIVAAGAAALMSSAAIAQDRLPPPPEGPTVVECRQGYDDSMPWTLQEFVTACQKLREDQDSK